MIGAFTVSYRENPLGLDELPRFSWQLSGEAQNLRQIGYQLQVICQGKMVWDSGKVEADTSQHIPYAGSPLLPRTAYQVQVSVWDNQGHMDQATGAFETGLLAEENWQGQWITHGLPADDTASPIFKKTFTVTGQVVCARLYATACGVYEATVNGEKAGDAYLAPGWTSYAHRIEYQTYDVTTALQEGENHLAFTVGNGWYKGFLGFDERPNHYGDRTKLRAMLCVTYADGTEAVIATDDTWTVCTGSIRAAEFYYGETQDFTCQETEAGRAEVVTDLSGIGRLVAQEAEPVRVTARFAPQQKIVTPKGEIVFDFGQNLAGFVALTLPPLSGEKLVIRHAETLDKNGNFYTENLRTAKSEDVYVYGPEQVGQVARPHFTFHGFRYICVEGAGADVSADHFTACAIHTDMQRTGSFVTDNALVNQLVSNIQWGQRGNFIDVPTDCPQRNERLGWTGDAQVFCGTAAFNFNTALFFRKWLRDMAAESGSAFGVPHVVPNILGDQDGAAAWSDAATIIPWQQYLAFGDAAMLREQYPLMKTWVDYVTSKTGANGLWQTGFQYGDWLALDIESGSTDRTGGTDKYLVANAYYAYSAGLVQKAAEALGYAEDAAAYGALREGIVDAINDEFITKTGRLVCETQTACVLMLYFDLAKPAYRPRILQTLITNIEAHHSHLTTGFVGTPYLCHCLSENGQHALADEIFMKEDFPGWFYAVKKGATTIWERWNSVLPSGDFDESGMNSLNHYAYGSIGSWLYEQVAGIRPAAPGYKAIRIAPQLTKGMTAVDASYASVYGTIRSAWTCKEGKVTVDVTIPGNTTATLLLPEHTEEISLGSGSYHYEFATDTHLEAEPFTMESTLREVTNEPLGLSMLEAAMPGIMDNPMIQFAMDMSLGDMVAQGPEAKPLYEAIVHALNEQARAAQVSGPWRAAGGTALA